MSGGPLGLRRRRRRRVDVLFYTPFIGWALSDEAPLPPGGAETQILAIARGLARRGVRVAIIAYGAGDELPSDVDGVQIVPRLPSRGNKRLVGKLIEAIRIWRALWGCPSRTVVFRCAGLELGLIGLYSRLAGRRLVFSTANVIDFDFERITPKRRDLLLFELGIRLAHAIVVQTEEQVELCRSAFGRSATLIKSIAPASAAATNTPEAFLWVGRLVTYKRPFEYVALANAVPEARFWMIGVPAVGDDLAVPAESVISAAREVANLELLPTRSNAGIGELMSRAVASVNTAEFEGMPNVLLEAWARGVPALVLHHDPDGVVATHGLGGFAHGSPDRLAELAREQWEARYDREALSRRCRSYLTAHHSPTAVVSAWLNVVAVDPPTTEVRSREGELTCAA